MYKQTHSAVVVQGGGGMLMDPPPQHLEKISRLINSLWCALQDEVNIIINNNNISALGALEQSLSALAIM